MIPTDTEKAALKGELKRNLANRQFKANRNRQLARIHILKAELKLDRDQYEAVLWSIGRVESSAKLDEYGRAAVIKHMEAHVRAKSGTKEYPQRPNNTDTVRRLQLRKIEAYLTDAALPWSYAAELALHMYRKERIEFCGEHELRGIIAALDKEAKKRLAVELGEIFGQGWEDAAAVPAWVLFGFNTRRSLSKSAMAMSQVVRWWHGRLQAVCEWPVNLEAPECCGGCLAVAQARQRPA